MISGMTSSSDNAGDWAIWICVILAILLLIGGATVYFIKSGRNKTLHVKD